MTPKAGPFTDTRDYTAVFTLEMPRGSSDEDWLEALDYIQDHFDTQWTQTVGTGNGWTVTIHVNDQL